MGARAGEEGISGGEEQAEGGRAWLQVSQGPAWRLAGVYLEAETGATEGKEGDEQRKGGRNRGGSEQVNKQPAPRPC